MDDKSTKKEQQHYNKIYGYISGNENKSHEMLMAKRECRNHSHYIEFIIQKIKEKYKDRSNRIEPSG